LSTLKTPSLPDGPNNRGNGSQWNIPTRCRNRHRPKCQGAADGNRLAEREAGLLSIGYFHAAFTLPAEIADIARQDKATPNKWLFRVVSETMTTIAADRKPWARASASLACSTLGDRR
jgi:hypothetical protein